MLKVIHHFINGKLVDIHSKSTPVVLVNPATGSPSAELYYANEAVINDAINGAAAAFSAWAATPAVKRARILFKFKQLLEEQLPILSAMITAEHGKTLDDAKGEVLRGIEVVEFACGIPQLLKGSFSDNVGTQVDSYTLRSPLGICVGFTPFNFPAMVPMWMFPLAIACGNCFILKPSEKVPSLAVKLAELFTQAGLPDGVLQVVHGDKTVVDLLLAAPQVQAVSFVGSTPVAKYIYAQSALYGKRVQALGGAKNHCVVMPDADLNNAVNGIMGAAFGAAGQRCMAISVVVAVGNETADLIIAKLKSALQNLKVGNGVDANIEMGPIQNSSHRAKIMEMIEKGVGAGADLVVDGRSFGLVKKSPGFFLGPTLFDRVTIDMEIYQQEIFGPVLCVLRAENLDEAIKTINAHPYGNGAAIYTQDGSVAHKFVSNVEAGMVGVNIPIPVPMAFYSFGGWKGSMYGYANMHGQEGVNFYTKLKTVTARWSVADRNNVTFEMPVSS